MQTRAKGESALSKVAQYYLHYQHLPSMQSESAKQILLALVSISGAPLYAIPAYDFAKENFGDSDFYNISFIVGTCTPALVVLYNSTDFFLIMRGAQHVPKELLTILINPLTFKQRLGRDIAIFTGSLLSAIPLAVISLVYPIPGVPTGVTYTLATAALIDNTVLHFLPIQLAMQQERYRIPVLPLEYGSRFIMRCLESAEQKEKKALAEKKMEIYGDLKNRLIGSLMQSQKNISIGGMKFTPSKLAYTAVLPDDLKQMAVAPDKTTGIEKLTSLANYKLPGTAAVFNYGSSIINELVYGVGAFWVVSSCSGYLAATPTLLTELTGSLGLGVSLALPSMYFLTVLMSFWGGSAAQEIYQYLTAWGSDEIKIPLEFKLYPKSFALLTVFAVYISVFSYATANKLIDDNFSDKIWDDIRPGLVWLSRTGVPYLGLYAMLAFYKTVINKFAMLFGGDDEKTVVRLKNMISSLVIGIGLMPGEELFLSLKALEAPALKLLVNLTVQELDEIGNQLAVASPKSTRSDPELELSVSIDIRDQHTKKKPPAAGDNEAKSPKEEEQQSLINMENTGSSSNLRV